MCPDSRRKLQPRDPKCYHLTMSTEEHIAQLTAQITTLQAQLACCSWSPPPPQPSAAPPPPLKPPKVSAPSPFSEAHDDLDCFEQVIHPCLQERIYQLKPMPTTWAECKCKTFLLNNQWRHF